MDWIHCNTCWTRVVDVKNLTFSITSCGHIFCDNCTKTGNRPDHDTCQVCGRECSRRILDSEVGHDIQQFFTDSREILKKALDVVSFQNGHRERLMGYLFGVVAKYKILKKEAARLADTLNSVQKKAKTLEKENIYLKQKLSSLTASQTSPTSQSPTFFLSPSQSPSPTAASQSSPSMGPPGSLFPRRPMSQTQWSPYFSKLITSNRLSLRQNKPNSEIRASQSYASTPTAMNSYRATNIGTPVTPVTAKSSPSFSDTQSPLTPADLNYIRSGRTSNVSPTLMNLNTLSLNSQQKTNKNSSCMASSASSTQIGSSFNMNELE